MSELRPSTDLLDLKFDGYKLSLATLPVYKLDLTDGVDVVEPSEEQYSFLHQREFSMHNHLHPDPFQPGNFYFIDSHWNINKIIINDLSGRPEGVKCVLELPGDKHRSGGEFNMSLVFPSEHLALVGDGCKSLHLVDTPSRSDPASVWQIVHSEEVFKESRPFHVVDSVWCENESTLHCVLLHVELKTKEELEADQKESKNASKYETVLQWLTFSQTGEEGKKGWSTARKEELRGSGKVEYVALEEEGVALYVASHHPFKFPRLEREREASVTDQAQDKSQENGHKVDYEWQQSFDDVTLYIGNVENDKELTVDIQQSSVSIKRGDTLLLGGTLTNSVSGELTTWTVNKSRLEVVLQKSEAGSMWQKLLSDPKEGEKCFVGKEIVDPALQQDIHNRLAHLTSDTLDTGSGVLNDWEMEECDTTEEESTTLYRFQMDSPDPTHKILVGSNQWLLTLRQEGGRPQSMVIRNDVDGCVWRPCPPEGTKWPVTHVGTFLAFGYVLASKVNRKFSLAPPDLSYVSVVDNTGHVIIYRQGVTVSGELRNRKTNKQVQSIATQNMINLQTRENILGAAASTSQLLVLTSTALHLISLL